MIKLESASKTNHKRVNSHSGTPLGVGTSHGHFDTQDSPRPRLGGSHHLPPYSILYSSSRELHPNGTFSRDSQGGVPKLSWNCPGLESQDFGSSYLPIAESDQNEVWTEVVVLFKSFLTPCRTLESDVGKRSIPDF